jgi:hypothetical protein
MASLTVNVSPKNPDGTPIGGEIRANEFETPQIYPAVLICTDNYTMTAIPNEAAGYEFDRWMGDISSTEPTISVSIQDGAKAVTAVFILKPEKTSLHEPPSKH